MKIKTLYSCNQCGFQTPKWLGKCPECENWNSFIEETIKQDTRRPGGIKAHARAAETYEKVFARLEKNMQRLETGIRELDRVFGGGIVPGSLNLLAGEPGIGKSTLTLQICESLSRNGKKVLYISGEESEEQISLRGKRLNLKLENFSLLHEVSLESILATLDNEKPDFAVIDSIQVVFSENIPSTAGTVTQVRSSTEALMAWAKPQKIPILIIGHVTKDGSLAGPKVLEHLVDGVFLIEGDRFHEFRLLRGLKNRFGGTNEVGIFEMTQAGMKEVKNPSAYFLESDSEHKPGVAVVATLEGSRPLFVEVQALVTKTRFGYPRRMASGFDVNRLHLLIAVIERHLSLNLGEQDVFINVVGGLTLSEPAADLGITLAILSSLKNKPLPRTHAFAGEVGLSGEIRKISQLEKREKEAKNLGLTFVSSQAKNLLTLFSRYSTTDQVRSSSTRTETSVAG